MKRAWIFYLAIAAAGTGMSVSADDATRVLTVDHYVRVASTVPVIAGQPAQLYVRERVLAGTALRGRSFDGRVVLFVHGAGTPAEVSFDVPYKDYSWMAYLAQAGYDVFSVDMTGYGRSTRPFPMNDPCNLAPDRQAGFTAACKASYPGNLTTIASDWDDVGAAVDYVRALRRVDRVSLVAWSLGGPRAGGYAARNPQKVNRLVLLAPAYNRQTPAAAPAKLPVEGVVFNTQSRAEFDANWDRQLGCPGQFDAAARDSVWSDMLASDPVGASWGPGVRRAPQTTSWGWDTPTVQKQTTPTLIVQGIHDKQVNPARSRELYADLGAPDKVFVDLGCSSHNAMWETNHSLLFAASLEWLEKGTVNGSKSGELKIGYEMGRVKGSDVRAADRPIDPLFVDRWSPRAMSGESISQEELLRLFEAARWAPSSGNSQPWRMLYAHRDTPSWPTFFGLLAEGNKTWCVHAAVLVVFVSQTIRDGSDRVLPTHSYDTGSAWMSLAYQGWMSGYIVHGMAGFDYERARTELGVPKEFHVNAMCAIGRPGPLENLSEALQAREKPSLRKPVEEFAFEGRFQR